MICASSSSYSVLLRRVGWPLRPLYQQFQVYFGIFSPSDESTTGLDWPGAAAAGSSREPNHVTFWHKQAAAAAGALAGVRGRGRDQCLGAVCSMGTLEIGLGCKDNAIIGRARDVFVSKLPDCFCKIDTFCKRNHIVLRNFYVCPKCHL